MNFRWAAEDDEIGKLDHEMTHKIQSKVLENRISTTYPLGVESAVTLSLEFGPSWSVPKDVIYFLKGMIKSFLQWPLSVLFSHFQSSVLFYLVPHNKMAQLILPSHMYVYTHLDTVLHVLRRFIYRYPIHDWKYINVILEVAWTWAFPPKTGAPALDFAPDQCSSASSRLRGTICCTIPILLDHLPPQQAVYFPDSGCSHKGGKTPFTMWIT